MGECFGKYFFEKSHNFITFFQLSTEKSQVERKFFRFSLKIHGKNVKFALYVCGEKVWEKSFFRAEMLLHKIRVTWG